MSVLVVQAFRPAVLFESLARGNVRQGEQKKRERDDDVQQVQHRYLRLYQAPRLVPHHQITPSVAVC